MLEQSSDSQRFKILPKEPSPEDLEAIMVDASREAGVKFYFGWTLADERNFALSIERGGSIDDGCEWRMFSGDGKEAVELWYLATDDPVIIKELIREASAKNLAGAGAAASHATHPGSLSGTFQAHPLPPPPTGRMAPKPKPVPHHSSSSSNSSSSRQTHSASKSSLPPVNGKGFTPTSEQSFLSTPAEQMFLSSADHVVPKSADQAVPQTVEQTFPPANGDALSASGTYGSLSSKKNYVKTKNIEPVPQSTFTNIPIDDTLALMPKEEMLKGNLKLVHITNLLQSIGMGAMSGRLKIQRHASVYADIFFLNGLPVHAEGTRGVGEDCFLQVVCWSEGDFMFEPKLKTDEQTINRSLESLILEGCLLLDHTNYLMQAGVRMTSVFQQINEDLTEAEFEEVMSKGDQLDMTKLKDFYVEVDGREVLEDIVNELDLLRSQWVPIVSNLLRMNVIELCESSEQNNPFVQPKDINIGLVDSVRQGLVAPQSGIFSYAAFLFLLGVQIKCSTMPLSVLLIELKQGSAKNRIPLTPDQIQELAYKVDKLTSSRNIFAHYEENDFAVILLGVRADKAARIADRLVKSLVSGFELGDGTPVYASIGVASHPDDAQDMGSLLGETERAKTAATKSGAGVCMAND